MGRFPFITTILLLIAPVLHPRHKLSYFKNTGRSDVWIQTARHVVRSEYEQAYRTRNVNTSDESGDESEEERRTKKKTNIFDSLPALAAPKQSELLDELDRYLSTDPEHAPNPLAWWRERRKMYPTLSRMALDYLSIPGMYI
jgi:hypothetical protein